MNQTDTDHNHDTALKSTSIAILGAGIGGLTAAIAFKRLGLDVAVYERHSAPTTLGAGVVLWPNASFVLHELGLLPRVAALAGLPPNMRRVSEGGHDLGNISVAEINEHMGFPSYSILRTDLHSVLTEEAARLQVDIRYDHAAVSIDSIGDGATCVTFSNGIRIVPAVVVGADGRMNSVARRYVNGNNAPVYQGFVNWVATLDGVTEVVNDASILDVWGVGDRFGIVPISRSKIYWAGATARSTVSPMRESPNKRELSDRFAAWPDPIPSIIKITPESSIKKIHVYDHDPIESWHRDNVILFGDAAHAALPTSGQGACQAMEDAWHFTKCVERTRESVVDIFAEFTQLRLAKTSRITHGARSFAQSLFNRDADFCRVRNLRSTNADHAAIALGMAHGWSEGLPLRDHLLNEKTQR